MARTCQYGKKENYLRSLYQQNSHTVFCFFNINLTGLKTRFVGFFLTWFSDQSHQTLVSQEEVGFGGRGAAFVELVHQRMFLHVAAIRLHSQASP